MATINLVNGKVKVQIESLLGTNPGGGWVYQAAGKGNNPGAEGAHYYYKSQTQQGSHKTAPQSGRFSLDINVQEAGTYSILLRASRDTVNPGDARNDIWIKVDGGTQSMVPKGTKQLTSGGDGFVKYKSAPGAHKWVDAKTFSTPVEGDNNAPSDVVFSKGLHKIIFAPRSTGYHIDSVTVIKKGMSLRADDLDATAAAQPEPDKPGVVAKSITIEIAAKHDDFETNKAGASDDLEFGRDGDGAQSVGLRFDAAAIDPHAEIKSAYFQFQAAETSKGAAHFVIEVEDTTDALVFSKANAPDDRDYLAQDVDWNPGQWQKGEIYKSADITALIEAVIAEGGAEALDALAFRISGTGERVAEAFEGDGHAPELVVNYA
jgi:hypothetical protein